MKLSRFIVSVTAAMALLAGFAVEARTAADFFVSAPDEVLPLVPQSTRLDMLDYFSSGLSTTSPNATRGRARIMLNEPTKLQAELSRDSNIQIALFPAESDTVSFYDTSWNLLALTMPSLKPIDFVPESLRKEASKAELPDVVFGRIDFNPETGYLTVNNTTAGYYAEQDRPDGLALMSTSIQYALRGNRLRKVANTSDK